MSSYLHQNSKHFLPFLSQKQFWNNILLQILTETPTIFTKFQFVQTYDTIFYVNVPIFKFSYKIRLFWKFSKPYCFRHNNYNVCLLLLLITISIHLFTHIYLLNSPSFSTYDELHITIFSKTNSEVLTIILQS